MNCLKIIQSKKRDTHTHIYTPMRTLNDTHIYYVILICDLKTVYVEFILPQKQLPMESHQRQQMSQKCINRNMFFFGKNEKKKNTEYTAVTFFVFNPSPLPLNLAIALTHLTMLLLVVL